MPVPDFQAFFVPVLRSTTDGAEHSAAELRDKVAAVLNLTDSELGQKLPSGTQSVFANRVTWATVYLTKAAALRRSKRGVFQITERGRELLRENPDKITVQTLNKFPEFVAFHKGTTFEWQQERRKVRSYSDPRGAVNRRPSGTSTGAR